MWKRSRSVFDEPIMILFWEWDEALLLIFLIPLSQFALKFVPVAVWWKLVFSIVPIAATGWFLYCLKRGKPSGAVAHWLHRMEFWVLPGVLPPRDHVYSPWP